MFSRTPFFLSLLALLPIGATASAQVQLPIPTAPPPTGLPIHQTFLTSDDGWLGFGEGAKVSVVPNPLSINSANGALQLDYAIGPGKMTAFLLPIGPGALAGTRSIRFEIRSDYAAKLIFGIQEQDGGRYLANFAVPKDAWQMVELAPSDFILSAGPDDPKDPDNKLDLDQVQAVGLVDAGILFSQTGNQAISDLFGIPNGPHHLYLADFQISSAPLPGSYSMPASPDSIDTFVHPQLGWLTIGGIDAKTVSGEPLSGRGLATHYTQAPGKIAGMIHFTPRGKFAGASKLSLSVASTKAANLLLQVEDAVGNKFNTQIYVPAGAAKAGTFSVSFADFKPSGDTKDPNAHLDLTQTDRLLIFDATGMLGNVTAPTENTLFLGDLRVIRP